MGRSLRAAAEDPTLNSITGPVTVYDRTLDHYFQVSKKAGEYFQSEYQLDSKGQDIFRSTHKLEYAVGSGINGIGYLIRRDRYLFEAPLTWYTKRRKWDLSPGYEGVDRGFSRPIEQGCIVCHSGQPQAIADRPGLFANPPFLEMPIGCENCHGPGEAHVRLRGGGKPVTGPDATIVNPARLSPRLAEEICQNCHQEGAVRVLLPGKQLSDFRPGMYSSQIFGLFDVPLVQGRKTESEFLEYHFEMKMSKCFRSSGKLGCLTCHDPHQQPAGDAAVDWFRSKCLACHSEQSCRAPRIERAKTEPVDNCVSCHMPRRGSDKIPHAMVSDHRIVRRRDEPFPEEAYRQTTSDLPDLVWLNRPTDGNLQPLAEEMRAEAYGLLMRDYTQFRVPFLRTIMDLLDNKKATLSPSLTEFVAREAAKGESDPPQNELAISLMRRAISQNVSGPSPYLDLAAWLKRDGKLAEAVDVLRNALSRFPFDRGMSRSLIDAYGQAGEAEQRTHAIESHLKLFPEDTSRFMGQ
jgi:hypothetical protein